MGLYIEGLDKQVQKGAESITVIFWDKDELIINEYDIGDMSKVIDFDLVRCRECKHRDPEDKKCDCGMGERQGCIFPVADDYFCKYGERRE